MGESPTFKLDAKAGVGVARGVRVGNGVDVFSTVGEGTGDGVSVLVGTVVFTAVGVLTPRVRVEVGGTLVAVAAALGAAVGVLVATVT